MAQLGFEQELGRHTIIGIDTTPFIYLWEKHSRYLSLSTSLLHYLNSPQAWGVTSIITLIEACVYPQRKGRHIRVPDALQIAAAVEGGATLFVTNDRHLKRVSEIQVVLFDEYVEE